MHPAFVRSCVLPLMMRRTWPQVQRLRRELESSQWLPPPVVRERTAGRLRRLLEHAAARSSWYREGFLRAGVRPAEVQDLTDLRRFPVLEKADLQEHREQILVEGAPRGALTLSATGGTTGEPTRYYWDDAYWCRSSAVSLRAAGFMGFEPGGRHAMIWGTAFHRTRRAAWKERAQQRLRNVMVVPGFELSDKGMDRWAARLARWQPELVEGYTSLLVLFARHLLRRGLRRIRPRAVVASAETLYDFQRELIGEAFGAPVFDRYGSREVGCIAHECGLRSGLHVNVEHVLVEVVRGSEPVPPGESGEILVTSLSNEVFPFIRYRIGDLGSLREEGCPCGRGLPLLDLTEGRVHDLLLTAKGTYLPGEFFPHLFKEYPGVEAFQVHQRADHSVVVRIVRGAEWDTSQEAHLKQEVARALGAGLPVSYEYVEEIPRTTSGKLRFTVSDVPVDPAAVRAAPEARP